eukprot:CAMPEP_0198145984 /NCGR_PEP_ID=MMETSP1443-20131203/26677_1 /TAXON_ID=186043 /ORGANISM="Entomoneis sp., Strain CCMP2396" /LENGTH=121 /DNA_ID=CAMNT_0043809773 /DNA_START=186 /DNA_END=551 /DNA_ORIENTATION=+
MGLSALPNDLNNARKSTTPLNQTESTVVELFDIPESDKPSRRSKFPLDADDEKYIAKCMTKWGDDYSRMFRDIKTNNMQHTETQLRKMGSRFLLLAASQRRLPVPEKVMDLLPGSNETNES